MAKRNSRAPRKQSAAGPLKPSSAAPDQPTNGPFGGLRLPPGLRAALERHEATRDAREANQDRGRGVDLSDWLSRPPEAIDRERLRSIASQIRGLVGTADRAKRSIDAAGVAGRYLIDAVNAGLLSAGERLDLQTALRLDFGDLASITPLRLLERTVQWLAEEHPDKFHGGPLIGPEGCTICAGWIAKNLPPLGCLLEEFAARSELEGATPDSPSVNSLDFRSVVWNGECYSFTKNQAACVRLLWEAWEAKTPELDGLTVVTRADVAQARLIDVFKFRRTMHAAWGVMIVPGTTKGSYRLRDRQS